MKLFDKLKNRKAKERREKVAELVRSAKGWEAECAILKERADTFKYGYDMEKEKTAKFIAEKGKLCGEIIMANSENGLLKMENSELREKVAKLTAKRDKWKETAGIGAAVAEEQMQWVKKLQSRLSDMEDVVDAAKNFRATGDSDTLFDALANLEVKRNEART